MNSQKLSNGDKVYYNGTPYIYGEGEYMTDDGIEIYYSGLWTPTDWECEEPPSFCLVEHPEDFAPMDDGTWWGYVLYSSISTEAA